MKRTFVFVVLLAVAGAGAWYASGQPSPARLAELARSWTSGSAAQKQPDAAPAAVPQGRRGGDTGPVRVAVALATKQDVPVYISGLGVVTAMRQATIKPQVDGPIKEILFKEGQPVHAGDVLARIDPSPFAATLRKAEADVAQNKAALVLNRQLADRQRSLGAREYASRETVETADSKVTQSEATLASSMAAAESARLDLEHTSIRAPWDGLAGMRAVDEGNMIRASDSSGLVVLTQVDPIAVVFTLPADSLPPSVRNPGAVKRAVSLLARDRKTEVATGELLAVDNLIDQNTNAIKLKATFANPDFTLWPGQFVTARLAIDTMKGVIAVPTAAVQRSSDGTFVFVVKKDPGKGTIAEQRPVTVDLVQNDVSVIGSGLAENETVVIDGQYRLKNGSPVLTGDAKRGNSEKLAQRQEP